MNLGAVKCFVVRAAVVASCTFYVSLSTVVSIEFISWIGGFGAVALREFSKMFQFVKLFSSVFFVGGHLCGVGWR